ncbi:hypothetical protein N7516_006269 [Penicillium verrucosum]|uniref:uncharacterized protein n=1 Tax=Penicillium verrucosum TaxID=60171 RepID=UPI0025451566|nr:uncharacterized protein N7516_006269 [Penicillium verrucosum]KAJ5931780.1 hypothetical protein N7516_006269 [Penicillium verrucosum]
MKATASKLSLDAGSPMMKPIQIVWQGIGGEIDSIQIQFRFSSDSVQIQFTSSPGPSDMIVKGDKVERYFRASNIRKAMPSSFPGITSPRYLQTITPTSVSVECGTATSVIVNCVEQISLPGDQEKEVWLAEINGVRRVLKSWIPDLDALFDNEAAVYHRLETAQPPGSCLFPKCIARGQVICSSLSPAGYVITMEYREGEGLCDIWHMLNAAERAHVENECLKAIHALRAISIRLDDPGKHNVLYARESRAVTLLDFEVVAPLATNTLTPTSYEMGKSPTQTNKIPRIKHKYDVDMQDPSWLVTF